MTNTAEISPSKPFPRSPFIAGLWLVAGFPAAQLIMYPFHAWVLPQAFRVTIGLPLVGIAFGVLAYMWANSLLRRSGWQQTWLTGLAGAIGILATTLGIVFGGLLEPLFGGILSLLNIPVAEMETHLGFYVVFVIWTGIVCGVTGFAVGLALKQWKLAFKLLGVGFGAGALVFLAVALGMELLGFRVGTPRADGLPTMPIVTVLGIWVTALIGSELLGRVMAGHRRAISEKGQGKPFGTGMTESAAQ